MSHAPPPRLLIKGQIITDHGYLDNSFTAWDDWETILIQGAVDQILKTIEVDTKDFTEMDWESVFWLPEFERPDKVSRELNEWKSNNNTKNTSDSESRGSGSGAVNISASGLWEVLDLGGKLEGSGSSEGIKREIKELLEDALSKVEWDGEKFQVKPMKLSRIDLGELETGSSFDTNQVQHYSEMSEERMAVRFDCDQAQEPEFDYVEINYDKIVAKFRNYLQMTYSNDDFDLVNVFDPKKKKLPVCCFVKRTNSESVMFDFCIGLDANALKNSQNLVFTEYRVSISCFELSSGRNNNDYDDIATIIIGGTD